MELTDRIGRKTGGVSVSPFTSSVRGQADPAAFLMVSGKSTSGNAGGMLELFRDILLTARLDDQARFKQVCALPACHALNPQVQLAQISCGLKSAWLACCSGTTTAHCCSPAHCPTWLSPVPERPSAGTSQSPVARQPSPCAQTYAEAVACRRWLLRPGRAWSQASLGEATELWPGA